LADIIFLVLLIIHVGFIVAWLGGAVLFVSIITPALAKISASSRIEFTVATLPRYVRFIGVAATGSVVAGVLLLLYISGVATSLAPSGSGFPFIGVGALFGLAALVIATGVVIPAGNKLVRVLKSISTNTTNQIPSPMSEALGLQKRLRTGAILAVALLSVTLILMIIGANI
jgi:hypothetical protein